jgi:hypothetical protein
LISSQVSLKTISSLADRVLSGNKLKDGTHKRYSLMFNPYSPRYSYMYVIVLKYGRLLTKGVISYG